MKETVIVRRGVNSHASTLFASAWTPWVVDSVTGAKFVRINGCLSNPRTIISSVDTRPKILFERRGLAPSDGYSRDVCRHRRRGRKSMTTYAHRFLCTNRVRGRVSAEVSTLHAVGNVTTKQATHTLNSSKGAKGPPNFLRRGLRRFNIGLWIFGCANFRYQVIRNSNLKFPLDDPSCA